MLALLAERASGRAVPRPRPAARLRAGGHGDTAFLRSDELPGDAALGYLTADGLRTNVFHLPVRGNGDGGIYSTAADIRAFWSAFFGGRIVSPDWLRGDGAPRSDVPRARRYGLGFWLHASTDAVMLEGFDAGVSFRSTHHPSATYAHRDLQHVRRSVADRPLPRASDTRRLVAASRCRGSAPRPADAGLPTRLDTGSDRAA